MAHACTSCLVCLLVLLCGDISSFFSPWCALYAWPAFPDLWVHITLGRMLQFRAANPVTLATYSLCNSPFTKKKKKGDLDGRIKPWARSSLICFLSSASSL